ncbi:MAG: hypothetical protein WBP76_06615 [Leptotrichiaceae bacterium]|jgi:GH15 family glucan-1,4-alpha-glucosidase|nr:hypothetical protein [Leptotrichiaceae bacterium]MBP6167617.1 hypothetical protein [Leptotrichiaceae bacterium]MBP7025736.1 hypothetical protein [Leptotrichiaceae bacterium]MBP8636705.1 hypothetical protein [Leptotrichiaceae bacterium]MBP9538354.1 hypothetical protein [Leptotrichiaceae bacterium]
MIKRIMMRILFIGVPILVVVWLMFLIGIQVYITPFYTYYFDGNMERKINNTTISTSIRSWERIFTINAKNNLLLYVDDDENNKNIELVEISIVADNGKRIYYKNINKKLDNLKGIGEEFIIKKDEERPFVKKPGKNYLIFEGLNLKPSKHKYIDIILTLKYENKIFSYTQRIVRTVKKDLFRTEMGPTS